MLKEHKISKDIFKTLKLCIAFQKAIYVEYHIVKKQRILPKWTDSGDKMPGFDQGSPSWLLPKTIYSLLWFSHL